jgi:hypothetical protein
MWGLAFLVYQALSPGSRRLEGQLLVAVGAAPAVAEAVDPTQNRRMDIRHTRCNHNWDNTGTPSTEELQHRLAPVLVELVPADQEPAVATPTWHSDCTSYTVWMVGLAVEVAVEVEGED